MRPQYFILCLFCILTGCVALPGQEPFGEKTYSGEEAQSVYEKTASGMSQADFTAFSGCTISVAGALEDDFISYDIYKTDEYTAAYCQGYSEEYLWYDGWLYYYGNEHLAYRDMAWEKLQAEKYASDKWAFAQQMLKRKDGKLIYKYIPKSSEKPYLLTAEYDEAEWDGQTVQSVQLSFPLDQDGTCEGFGLSWQEEAGRTNRALSVSFFPYEGSSSLLAERKIWSFGYEQGLTKENIPALSDQKKNRKQSQAVITDMNFEMLRDQAEYNKNLSIPYTLH